MKRKQTLQSDAENHKNNFTHPVHDDEQQQQQAAAAAATAVLQHTTEQQQQKYMTGAHKYILERRAAAYSIMIIDQVKILCCEPAHGVHVTKTDNTTHSRAAAAAAAAALCMHIKLTSGLLGRHLNHPRTYSTLTETNKKREMSQNKKQKTHTYNRPGVEP